MSKPSTGRYLDFLDLAEAARRLRDWKTAAENLEKACECEPLPEAHGRLRWCIAECWYACSEMRRAYASYKRAIQESPPETAQQWSLAVRLCSPHMNPQFVLKTAADGLVKYPTSTELMIHVERLCEETGRWHTARLVLGDVAQALQGTPNFIQALRLQCAIAAHTEDFELALRSADLILKNVESIPRNHEYLRSYAAAVFASNGSLSEPSARVLGQGAQGQEIKVRIRIAAVWSSVKAEDWARACQLVDDLGNARGFTGDRFAQDMALHGPIGKEWNNLSSKLRALASDWLVAASHGFPWLAHADLRQRLREGTPHPALLHAFALLNQSIAERNKAQDLRDRTLNALEESLGAWTALLEDEDALGYFITNCSRRYAHTPPSFEVFREQVTNYLSALIQQSADPHRLSLTWDLERKACARISKAGGLVLGERAKINAGPTLARSLGLHRSVRAVDDPAVRVLYSPLGRAVALIDRREFEAATGELAAIATSAEQHGWRLEDLHEILLDCHLQASRDLVAQAPIEMEVVRRAWQGALETARSIGVEARVIAEIVKIATGRGEVLFERRTHEEREADPDKRNLPTRRSEAVKLVILAWQVTNNARLQRKAAELHNLAGVDLARKEQYDEAAEKVFSALELVPDSELYCTNVVRILRFGRRKKIEQNCPDDAGEFLLDGMNRLRALASEDSRAIHIQKGLATLADLGPVPFVERSQQAVGQAEWDLATKLMIWALRIAPDKVHVHQEAYGLYRQLALEIEAGHHAVGHLLDQLLKFMPRDWIE
jgi:tetratricopeptide (TPR) repeat protein